MKERFIQSALVILGVIIALCFTVIEAQAQGAPLDCVSMTGGNASVIVPGDIQRPNNISHVWAESPDGECVGIAEVIDAPFSMTVWGEDQFSAGAGIKNGERFNILAEKTSFTYAPNPTFSVAETYFNTDAVYQDNGIYVLSSLPEPMVVNEELRAALDSLSTLASSLTAELANAEAQHQADLAAQAQTYENTITQQRNQINNLQGQVATLEDQVAPLEARVTELVAEQDYALRMVRETNRILRNR